MRKRRFSGVLDPYLICVILQDSKQSRKIKKWKCNKLGKMQGLQRQPGRCSDRLRRFPPFGNNTTRIAVWSETLGVRRNCPANLLEGLSVYACVIGWGEYSLQAHTGREALPTRRPALCSSGRSLSLPSQPFQESPDPLPCVLRCFAPQMCHDQQETWVRGVCVYDDFVHPRLGEHRFVVSISTVTDDVNNDVFLPLGTVISSNFVDKVGGFYVVAVDMEYGSVDGFGDIRRVDRENRAVEPTWLL